MADHFLLVLQGTPDAERTAYSALANVARTEHFDEAIFISPFMTEQGAGILNEVAREAEVQELVWIVGLDGMITRPQALDVLASVVADAEQIGWRQDRDGPYLHAKVFILRRKQPRKTVVYIGSANATQGGLAENVEAGVLISREEQGAVGLDRELDAWISSLRSTSCCVRLTQAEKDSYARRYHPPQGRGKRVSRVVGAEERPRAAVNPEGKYAWIELSETAVTGWSHNQIAICKDMATFFTRGALTDRVDFDIVDAATGIHYSSNAYRFRHRNVGYRVEVNAGLARALDLRSASGRGDIVLLERTRSPTVFIVKLYSARSGRTQQLIEAGESEGRVHRTTSGPGGRRYYV